MRSTAPGVESTKTRGHHRRRPGSPRRPRLQRPVPRPPDGTSARHGAAPGVGCPAGETMPGPAPSRWRRTWTAQDRPPQVAED